MKITLERNEDQVALIKALASRDSAEAAEAKEAFADFASEIIHKVLLQAATLSAAYEDLEFDQYSSPTIPLDQYFDVKDTEYVNVWSQTLAGGLPTQITHGMGEMTFSTYPLNSALAFDKKYAAQARLDVISKGMTRMIQEFLIKQENNAAAVLLGALAKAKTTVRSKEFKHVIRSGTAGEFKLQDFNRLFTLIKRIRSSWAGGTPEARIGRGLTDVYVSPEIVEYFRGMSFNPLNTRGSDDLPGHEDLRKNIYESSGVPNFYGVNIIEINELGSGWKFNQVFNAYADGEAYGTGSGTSFVEASEEICIGIDRGMDVAKRPVETVSDPVDGNVSQVSVMPDDQFVSRSEKVGWYAKLREGRVLLDDRYCVGLIV